MGVKHGHCKQDIREEYRLHKVSVTMDRGDVKVRENKER